MQSHHQSGGDALPDFGRHPSLRRGLFLLAAVALVLGAIGYRQYDPDLPWIDALYHSAQHFIMHAPHLEGHVPLTLELGRWLAPVTLLIGFFRLVRLMLREETRQRSLSKLRGHVIVCGLGRKGMELVRHLRSAKNATPPAVVVIEKDPPPDFAAECEKLGAHLLTDDATKPGLLLEAGVRRAARIFAVCPEDATNCEIAVQVAHLRNGQDGGHLDCFVHLSTAELGQTLQQALAVHKTSGQTRLHAVDAFDPEAIALLVDGLPLDHAGVRPNDPSGVHLVILGFGKLGRILAVRAAQLGQFANGKRLRLSVIDGPFKIKQNALLFHNPQIGKAADLKFYEHEAASPAVRDLIEGFCKDSSFHTSVAICFDNEALALEIALRLLPLFDFNDARMAVRMEHQGGLAHLVEEMRRNQPQTASKAVVMPAAASEEEQLLVKRLSHLRVFGMSQQFVRLANPEEWPLEKFARKIHAAYVELTLKPAEGKPDEIAKLKAKPELQDWDLLPQDLRESNRQQAAHLFIKLRAVGCEAVPASDPRPAVTGFAPGDAQMLARLEHERWNAERWVAGWSYAEKKDIARRLNPNLVPWEKLKPEIQQYDHDTVSRLPKLLETAGMKIVRQEPAQDSPSASV